MPNGHTPSSISQASSISAQAPPGSPGTTGATLRATYLEREMKVCAVTESELKMISVLNAGCTVLFAFASSFASLAIGIKTSGIFTPEAQIPAAGQVLLEIGVPLLVVLAVLCALGGIIAFVLRKSESSKIWKSAKEVGFSVPVSVPGK